MRSPQIITYSISWYFVFSKQNPVEMETLVLKAILRFGVGAGDVFQKG